MRERKKDIERSLGSYKGQLDHGHTYKLKKKVYGEVVLTKALQEMKGVRDEY